MGLEYIEFLSRTEEDFAIDIPDETFFDLVDLVNVKQLTNYLMSRPEVSQKHSRDEVTERIWASLEEELGINRKDFDENSRFIQDLEMG